jgi:hypothetical protein
MEAIYEIDAIGRDWIYYTSTYKLLINLSADRLVSKRQRKMTSRSTERVMMTIRDERTEKKESEAFNSFSRNQKCLFLRGREAFG